MKNAFNKATGTSVQPHKYEAKELDRENGLDLYNSHARWYDPLLSRTTTQDPLAEKYRHLSPYAWCAGNPIRNIDEGSDSIAVLYYHGLIGLLALLIQDENKKWSYFSMNGTKIFGGSSGMSYGKSGGKPYKDLGIMKFNSPTEFLNSQYNREGSYDEIQDNTVNNYGYEDAYVIPTTREQDASIERVFRTEARKSYNLFLHQCAHVVQNALNAGGLKTTLKKYNVTNFEMETVPFMPSSTFEAIRQKNKQGKLIKRKWKK